MHIDINSAANPLYRMITRTNDRARNSSAIDYVNRIDMLSHASMCMHGNK